MTDAEIARIKRFIADRELQETIKKYILAKFTEKKHGADVHILASQTLATQSLEDAWNDLERYKQNAKADAVKTNHGV